MDNSTGAAVWLTFDGTAGVVSAPLELEIADAATSTTVYPLIVSHTTSMTAGSLGVGVQFDLENDAGTKLTAGQSYSRFTSAIAGAEISSFTITGLSSGSLVTFAEFTPTTATFQGDIAFNLAANLCTIDTSATAPRTYTFPDTSADVVLTAGSQTLTNKTLTLPIIASISNGGTITIPSGAGTFATIAATQTLTNKTLTTPTIGSFVNATHTHQDAAGGGTLSAAAIASGTLAVARGGTGVAAMQNFSGYRNTNYSIPAASWNKLPIDSERWDVGSTYDNATNYRFTPTVAGTYLVAGHFYSTNPVSNNLYAIAVYKNGALAVLGSIRQITATRSYEEFIAFGMVQLNGTTDYVELYGYNGHASATLTLIGGVNNNQFAGSWLAPSS